MPMRTRSRLETREQLPDVTGEPSPQPAVQLVTFEGHGEIAVASAEVTERPSLVAPAAQLLPGNTSPPTESEDVTTSNGTPRPPPVEISESRGQPIGSAECKSKWHSLRSAHARHHRESKDPIISAKKQKQWYQLENLSFLNDFVGRESNAGSGHTTVDFKGSSTDDDEVDEDLTTDDYSNAVSILPLEVSLQTVDKCEISDMMDKTGKGKTPQQIPTKMPKKKNRVPAMTYGMAAKSATQPRPPAQMEENTTIIFFKSLIPDIDRLSRKRKRQFKEDVMRKLHEYLDEQENEPKQQQSFSLATLSGTPSTSTHLLLTLNRPVT